MRITKENIYSKNLNLLAVFNELFEVKSVSGAAKRLRMSQPNLSRALKLLREEFGDPLFVRGTSGLSPTKRAIELSAMVRDALNAVEKIYVTSDFDPKTATGKFTIATTDYLEFLLAPRLVAWISEEAPGLALNFRPSHGNLPKLEMEKGECDLNLLVVRETIPPAYFKQDLFRDPYTCAVRKGHPLLKGKVTIDKFIQYGHTLINPQGTMWALTDELLLRMGKKRQVVMGSPNALSNVFALVESDLVLTATRAFLEMAAGYLPIQLFQGPFQIEPIQIAQIWHERAHTDPLNQWIRHKIRDLVRPTFVDPK